VITSARKSVATHSNAKVQHKATVLARGWIYHLSPCHPASGGLRRAEEDLRRLQGPPNVNFADDRNQSRTNANQVFDRISDWMKEDTIKTGKIYKRKITANSPSPL
jgi:hypothetical protein